jgi:hypothetical protein
MFDVQLPHDGWMHKGFQCRGFWKVYESRLARSVRPRRVSPEAACLPRVGFVVRVALSRDIVARAPQSCDKYVGLQRRRGHRVSPAAWHRRPRRRASPSASRRARSEP